MEYQTLYHNMNHENFVRSLAHAAEVQNIMAANTKEDVTYWHHLGLADLLLEVTRRLKNAK